MTLFAAIFVGGFNYMRTVEDTLASAIESLAGETRLMALRFKQPYDEMGNDVLVVAHTPPIQGIMRSMANNNVDPKDGSTTNLWRTRLETIFKSIMASRPHYTQMRYIGVSDNGRELVRVNRQANEFVAVSPNDLQSKSNEPYFRAALKTQEGNIYYSEVTYNKEHGQVDGALIPTVRTVIPVYNNDTIFGMIVINADYPNLLRSMFESISPNKNVFIINHVGDYMEYKDDQVQDFEFHQNYTHQAPGFVNHVKTSQKNEITFTEGDNIAYFVRMPVNPDNNLAFLGVLLQVPYDELMAGAYETRNQTLLLTVILVVIAIFVSITLTSWLTRPLKKMTDAITNADKNKRNLNLPTTLNDEIGELARAFDAMTGELIASETKTKAILENANDGIITINKNGIIEGYNPACQKTFGYTASEVLGKNVNILMPDPYHQEHDGYLNNYHNTGEKKIIGVGREVEAKRKDGSVFPAELSVSEFTVGGKKFFTGFARDITDRKKAEEEIKKANKELETFTYIASHDLRSPLINLKGYSAQLEKYVAKIKLTIQKVLGALDKDDKEQITFLLEERIPEALGFINNGVDKMDSMTDAILQLSRTGRRELKFVNINTNQLVRKCAKVIQHQLDEKNGEMIIGDLPDIIGDMTAIEQIFSNLLDNAVKYLSDERPGSIEISGKTNEGVYKGAWKTYEFQIKDNGRGIDEKDFDKVFAVFRRAGSSAGTKGEGMGLNYVKSLIQRHGGDIRFTSKLGEGTVFTFTISKQIVQIKTEDTSVYE